LINTERAALLFDSKADVGFRLIGSSRRSIRWRAPPRRTFDNSKLDTEQKITVEEAVCALLPVGFRRISGNAAAQLPAGKPADFVILFDDIFFSINPNDCRKKRAS